MKTIHQLQKNKKLKIDDLQDVKRQLRLRIDEQQKMMMASAKGLVPFSANSSSIRSNKKRLIPLSILTTPLRKGKTISVVEGMLIGYKLIKSIRRVVKK
ncbi:MAG: hypothetical protein ACK5KP_01350 [Paludibacteraceae bacterium]